MVFNVRLNEKCTLQFVVNCGPGPPMINMAGWGPWGKKDANGILTSPFLCLPQPMMDK